VTKTTSSGATPGSSTVQPEVGEDLHHLVAGVVDPHQPPGQGDVQGVCRPRTRRVDISHARVDGATAELHEQVDGQLGGIVGHPRVDATLEPLGRLADQPVPTRCPGDRHRVEVGRFDEDVRCRLGDLTGRPTHDTGERERELTAVGDEQVFGGQLAVDAVEGGQPLPRPGPADLDRPGQGVQVESMQGLPDQEHDVVGDVDGQRDRAHPGLGQPAAHPPGDGADGSMPRTIRAT
jgi:hypothetical protein